MLAGSIVFKDKLTKETVHTIDMEEIGEVSDIEAYTHSAEFKDIVLKLNVGRVYSHINYCDGPGVITEIYNGDELVQA